MKNLTVMLFLLGIVSLVGCGGVSVGPSPDQPHQLGPLSLGNGSLNFGSVTPGSSKTLTVNATNGGNVSVSISGATISTKYFTLTSPSLPTTLAAGQSLTLSIKFTPNAAGIFSASAAIASDASNAVTSLSLTGMGAANGQLSVTPATLGLGNVAVGSSGTASGTLTANGANLIVTAASANNSVFSVGGLQLPVTIPAGQSASFTVTFSPQAAGSAVASLTFTSDAQPATTTEALNGTGTPAPAHAVHLSWDASTSANIAGYNVYRAPYVAACGSFGKINPALNAGTSYTDSTVVDGTSYCYTTTAVNSSNQESGYSNIDSNVQIPAP